MVAHQPFYAYSNQKGKAGEKLAHYLRENASKEKGLLLWGIGNHGGGPSREDLERLNQMAEESDFPIFHSSPDAYMAEVDRESLSVVRSSLTPCMIGCYTSMARIKQANRRLESLLSMAEKAWGALRLSGDGTATPSLEEARRALAFCQFHDVLPGTSIKPVEEDCLRLLSYGEELAERAVEKAFFRLCKGQKRAEEGEIPIFVFNPHPYAVEADLTVEFSLANQNWNEGEVTQMTVYDGEGRMCPTQTELAETPMHLDWIKRVCFRATLAPFSVSRFSARSKVVREPVFAHREVKERYIRVENPRMTVEIDAETGLIARYEVDGVPRLAPGGVIEVYADDEDPWGMRVDGFRDKVGEFRLMTAAEANAYCGYPSESYPPVRVVEDGAVRTLVEAYFVWGKCMGTVTYTLPKQGTYLGVDIKLLSAEPNKMIKYCLKTAEKGTPYGETAFGFEALAPDGKEAVYHRWCGVVSEKAPVFVLNRGTYGGSFSEDSLRLSLLRTPVYADHPIEQRPYCPHDRMMEHMDLGERSYSFRITTEAAVDRAAQRFNEPPRTLSFFPAGDGKQPSCRLRLDDPFVLLSAVKETDEGVMLRLYNTTPSPRETVLSVDGEEMTLSFGPHQIKTVFL